MRAAAACVTQPSLQEDLQVSCLLLSGKYAPHLVHALAAARVAQASIGLSKVMITSSCAPFNSICAWKPSGGGKEVWGYHPFARAVYFHNLVPSLQHTMRRHYKHRIQQPTARLPVCWPIVCFCTCFVNASSLPKRPKSGRRVESCLSLLLCNSRCLHQGARCFVGALSPRRTLSTPAPPQRQ